MAARPEEVLVVVAVGRGVVEAMVLFGLTVCVEVCTVTPLVDLEAPLVVVVSDPEPVPVGELVSVAVVVVVDVELSVDWAPSMRKPGDHCQ